MDAAAPVRTFRTPLGPRLASAFGVALLGGLSAAATVGAVALVLSHQTSFALILLAFACFETGLTSYVAHDLHGKWGLRVTLEPNVLVLDLPSWRSLIHKVPAEHSRIPYSDIAAIETRLEAYGSFGTEMLQRAYMLRRRDGTRLFLFEDRAVGTQLESSVFTKLAADIAARVGHKIDDLGMVEGRGGFLGVWGTKAADWSAPAPSLDRQRSIWRRVVLTGSLPIYFIIFAAAFRLFG